MAPSPSRSEPVEAIVSIQSALPNSRIFYGWFVVAANLDEATLIRAGAAFQSITSWHRRHPSLGSEN